MTTPGKHQRDRLRPAMALAHLAGVRGLPMFTALACLSAFFASTAQAQSAGGSSERARPVALVTGSTDGLGREVALRIAATGAHVIVHGRNRERGMEVVAEIEQEGKGSARFHPADLASLAEVRKLAETILRDYDRLDILVNNAGIAQLGGGAERRMSADGHELTFAVDYLSGYLLTRMLLPRLIASAPSRIINVSSLGQAPIDFDDPMLERGFSGGRAYSQSKLAQIMFTFDLAKELAGRNVIVEALHPATYILQRAASRARERPGLRRGRARQAEGAQRKADRGEVAGLTPHQLPAAFVAVVSA